MAVAAAVARRRRRERCLFVCLFFAFFLRFLLLLPLSTASSSLPLAPPRRTQLTMTILLAILILIDYMFLDDSHFIFDPSIQVRRGARARARARVVARWRRRRSFSPSIPTDLARFIADLPPSAAELCATNGAAELEQHHPLPSTLITSRSLEPVPTTSPPKSKRVPPASRRHRAHNTPLNVDLLGRILDDVFQRAHKLLGDILCAEANLDLERVRLHVGGRRA